MTNFFEKCHIYLTIHTISSPVYKLLVFLNCLNFKKQIHFLKSHFQRLFRNMMCPIQFCSEWFSGVVAFQGVHPKNAIHQRTVISAK